MIRFGTKIDSDSIVKMNQIYLAILVKMNLLIGRCSEDGTNISAMPKWGKYVIILTPILRKIL